jgi:hypothetical protein
MVLVSGGSVGAGVASCEGGSDGGAGAAGCLIVGFDRSERLMLDAMEISGTDLFLGFVAGPLPFRFEDWAPLSGNKSAAA